MIEVSYNQIRYYLEEIMKFFDIDKKIWTYIIGIAILVVCILNLDKVGQTIGVIWNAVKVLVFGGMIAYVLNLVMNRIEKLLEKSKNKFVLKIKRVISLLASLCCVALIIYFVLAIVIPTLGQAGQVLIDVLPQYFNDTIKFLSNLFENNPHIVEMINGLEINWKEMIDQTLSFLGNGLGNVLGSTFNMVNIVVNSVFNTILSIIFAIYVLLDKERFIRLYHRLGDLYLGKDRKDKLTSALKIINQSFGSFIGGQCIEATILGTLCATGMYLLNMPYPLMIGVLVGLINIIPMIGAYIGGAIGMFMVFTVDPMMSLGFLVYLCILQQFESNVIYPRVVGSSVGLPGIYVMMTVVIFGSLAGIPGMFLGIPTVASIYKLAKIHIQNKEKELETKKLESKTSVKN